VNDTVVAGVTVTARSS